MTRGVMLNSGRISDEPAKTYAEMDPLERARADVQYARHKGGFAYKQARAHYRNLLRRRKAGSL